MWRDSQTGIRVTVKKVKDGLPARTVLAAFAAMSPAGNARG